MVSIRSRTAAIMGAGKRYPASAGLGAFPSVRATDGHFLGGVGGGITRSGAQTLVGISGCRISYPVRLSLAVRALESMTICWEARNGIPRIRGTGSPILILRQKTVDFQLPFPDDNSIFTYSLQDSGDSESEERLSSSGGKGYRRRPNPLARSESITTEGHLTSSRAETDRGNSVILGPKASNLATR